VLKSADVAAINAAELAPHHHGLGDGATTRNWTTMMKLHGIV